MADPMDPLDPSQGIIKHGSRQRPFEIAIGDNETIDTTARHTEQYRGPIETVFYEVISDLVHVDVNFVPPSKERACITLVTSGMSDLPMTLPEECVTLGGSPYAELMISLPPSWPISQDLIRTPENYWPIRSLKELARMPHAYNTWLGTGHLIPNGQPPSPYASSTGLCGMLVIGPSSRGDDGMVICSDTNQSINLFALCPLYEDKMEYKLQNGTTVLLQRFARRGVSEVVDIDRPSAARRRRLFRKS